MSADSDPQLRLPEPERAKALRAVELREVHAEWIGFCRNDNEVPRDPGDRP